LATHLAHLRNVAHLRVIARRYLRAPNAKHGAITKLRNWNGVAQKQKQIETVTAQLKEQAAQIHKVSAQLDMSKPATTLVVNEP